MTVKQQQIQEMVTILEKAMSPIEYDEGDCATTAYPTEQDIAEELYDAGYREAEQVRKETAKEILQRLVRTYKDILPIVNVLEVIADEYGVEASDE